MNQFTFYTYGRTTVSDHWPIDYFTGANRLYYVNNGSAAYTLNGKTNTMKAGMGYLFPASLPVRFSCIPGQSFDHTFFDFVITPSFLLNYVPEFPGKVILPALPLFYQVLNSREKSETAKFLQSHFETILFLLSCEIPLHQSDDTRIKTALEIIHQNFSEPLEISDLAKKIPMDETHFIRIFKQATGFTPYQYLKQHRMNTALSLLKQGASVQKAASICGYQSSASFSSAFYHHFGTYPSKIPLN